MIESSHIYIDINALANNFSFLKEHLGSECELVSVVKGNAYGHLIEIFVPAAHLCGIKSFAVFSAYEAKKINDLGLELDRIVIMGFIDFEQVEWVIENQIEFYVFDKQSFAHVIEVAKQINTKAKIHIEVETGLNRTGFDNSEINAIFQMRNEAADFIELKGVCSHLAGAENITNRKRIKKQIKRFTAHVKNFQKENIVFEKRHLACSAAMMNYPTTKLDLARIGIMQFGLWPSKEVKMAYHIRNKTDEDPLEPVLSWKSKIMSTKQVKMGEYIGYGSSLQAEQDMMIATVPIGYADGFARSLSNQGKVLINGQRLDVIGVVNMNLFTVNITNTTQVKVGDEVVMIGKQGTQSISVASFSDFSSQLNYELLTRLPNDIPRLITN